MKKLTKSFLIAFAALSMIFIGMTLIVKSDKKFEVRHSEEVAQTVLPGGGYVAGSPETYMINVSPALMWELQKSSTVVWRGIAWALLLAAALFVAATDIGYLNFKAGDSSASYILFVILAAAIACYIAAYSSAYANNFVEVSPERYYQIKDNADSLKALFLNREYIR